MASELISLAGILVSLAGNIKSRFDEPLKFLRLDFVGAS
ncbi:MAG: hypothetical protein K0R55_4616 [Sporomusa sp.]|jgi:hypothetical protein|nr:hypothetical protein [Sporomusa sp.]